MASAAGDRTYWPCVVTAPEVGPGYDVVLLAVKSDALGAVMDDIAPAVTPSTSIVPFLNGIAHVDRLTARFGAAVPLTELATLALRVHNRRLAEAVIP